MKSRYWWASVIILAVIIIWLIYLGEGPHEKSLQPGTEPYDYYHKNDTIKHD